MSKFLYFVMLMMVSFQISATPISSINTEKLLSQKAYLDNINQCASPKGFGKLIKEAIKKTDKFETHAAYAASIEEMALSNPACFVTSSAKLEANDCQMLAKLYIKEPYFNPRVDLNSALSRAKDFNTSCLAS